MKLRRAWPAICIWVVFMIFDIVMVASYSYFSGLFPSKDLLTYSLFFSAISILVMTVLTFITGNVCDFIKVKEFKNRTFVKFLYPILIALLMVGGIWYRIELLASNAGDITGKYSLYENAMVGGKNLTQEYDLLSIVYSGLLKGVLVFTGNIISVPFYFQIACFAVFMICGFFTVKLLLGMGAGFVFTAYVAFMPVFTPIFTGLELSTDYLFMAMFGIELLFVALFLKGAYVGRYNTNVYIAWYIFVGIVVGFMAYIDAGTIIMILPFILSALMLYGRSPKKEGLRILFVILGAVIAFVGMLAQEAGFMMIDVRFSNWASYYFHNLNTFSMFWTYTDHKTIYLATVIAMSGVIVGFWKNRKVEKISPWLLAMIFIFATVPFMGATRMNTQVFVTVYYAFILGCVASLITLPYDEGGDEFAEAEVKDPPSKEAIDEAVAKLASEPDTEMRVITPDKSKAEYKAEDKTNAEGVAVAATAAAVTATAVAAGVDGKSESEEASDSEIKEETKESSEEVQTEDEVKADAEDKPVSEKSVDDKAADASVKEVEASIKEAEDLQKEVEKWEKRKDIVATVNAAMAAVALEKEAVERATAGEAENTPEIELENAAENTSENAPEHATENTTENAPEGAGDQQLFIPEGMVLPQDDEDADLTPRMKMPEFKGGVGPDGKAEKIRIIRKVEAPKEEPAPKDDFDIPLAAGDDFDI